MSNLKISDRLNAINDIFKQEMEESNIIFNDITTNEIEKTKKLPWIEKYRPVEFSQIVSHKIIIKSLSNFISKKTLPHVLFYGPSGAGKTSIIMCCANKLYGENVNCMVLQLNASNERGIETVRTKIKNFVTNKNNIFTSGDCKNMFKLVILDEIDSMTVEAQGMLRQTIEKNSSSTRFCLICNDVDKINIALQSRCALFRFPTLKPDHIKDKLIEIIQKESIICNDSAIDAIVKISKGDLRTAINTLQHVALTVDKIQATDVYHISGNCNPVVIENLFKKLTSVNWKKTPIKNVIDDFYNTVVDNNIPLFNLLNELVAITINSSFTTTQKTYLINNFAINEICDSVNVDTKIISMSIVSLFLIVNNL